MLKVKNKAGNKAGNKAEVKKSVNTYLKKAKLGKFSLVEAEKNMLKDLILRKNMSIYEASVRCDIDERRANFVLFDKKPTQNQIDYALEIYNKGLPMLQACVASGVSFDTFKKIRREQMQKDRNPQRW